ncbi:hypothetical protein K438DRAFT_1970877 [Mycena galopus ATCC 62051]|nr:hypothetical protein K438DRAFT_1997796 [Mycena galopus ATCC 62051]KAF8191128.1 hypothetical protein K438DRAFT_1970877 [Mycena galopus ATCC 62051]
MATGREPSDRLNAAKEANPPAKRKENPIRPFLTVLENKDPGDKSKSYRCNLGSKKIITLTASSNGNLSNPTLRPSQSTNGCIMFLLWNEKDAPSPTQEELDIAHGKKEMTEQVSRKFTHKLNKIQNSIEAAFEKQQAEKRASVVV